LSQHTDLESKIRRTFGDLLACEARLRDASDPGEQEHYRHDLDDLRSRTRGYIAEYRTTARDIDLIAAYISPQFFEPEMVLIPEGEFLMGSDPAKDKDASHNEHPQHRVYLPAYYVAKTPVTNAQYAFFLWSADHDQPEHWESVQLAGSERNHPVVNVTWHDVQAYCQWLTSLTGKHYCPPTEAEWEKAARGTDGRIYPWGDQWDPTRCNTREAGTARTSPVSAHPDGASPYGALDMAGNVAEWTFSLFREYPYDPDDGREDPKPQGDDRRVLRGGSAEYPKERARCASRNWLGQDFCWCFVGFRVALPLP
jgi:formylglycine-generating enzyme required for sulfatase activity